VGAVIVSEAIAFLILDATQTWGDFPRSIFVIDALVCIVLVGMSRFWERAFARGVTSLTGRSSRQRTLIVGAGRGGRSLLRELRETPGEQVVGFVDDDPSLTRRRLQGVAVLGGTNDIERIIGRARPDTVLVTIPDAPRERLGIVIDACARAEVPCRFVRRERDLDPRVILGAAAD
jgi:FlaA1/EpsC-like NDP-sugar epimerase